jgi:cysteine desulfurase / selenocysteine lyase
MSPELAYLDFAATAAVRPPTVADAVADYLRNVGATPGRSGHRLAVDAGRVALRCRMAVAELLGVRGDPGRIAFQPSATHALNAALRGVLLPGDRVVRTVLDHNSVRRPLAAMPVEQVVLGVDAEGGIDLGLAREALRGARLLVVPHASNVLGTVLPVAELAAMAHQAGALILVDAAQSAGHLAIDVEAAGLDLLAFAGHKGLLGPQGTGGLYVREGVELLPVVAGGTGSESDRAEMPDAMPDRLEPGTQNGPGLAGLLAGARWILDHGIDAVHANEMRLKARLREGLLGISGVRLRSPAAPAGVGIVTVTVDGTDPAAVAARLDREFGVLVRAGLHCAPEAHRLLGTERGGAVRFSVGWCTTELEVDRAVEAMATIAGTSRG